MNPDDCKNCECKEKINELVGLSLQPWQRHIMIAAIVSLYCMYGALYAHVVNSYVKKSEIERDLSEIKTDLREDIKEIKNQLERLTNKFDSFIMRDQK